LAVACGTPASQLAIASLPTRSAFTNVWLSLSATLNRVQRSAAFDAGKRDIALDDCELEL
jgi:hypothetical protein